ncbi:uncharacterized protein LOC107424145 isoform X1 [Ziziphus jujuba]|uniref:Uncharacterized protein LOC107424145 isoform X1 n=1 Tax=Ziziphus jujuba TaxID=326968 RepID=A0ABM3ICS8_ZIZJJ|nr:uncharacterized protein LOC107424145 isoform X1 [Ziziphus jujuba]
MILFPLTLSFSRIHFPLTIGALKFFQQLLPSPHDFSFSSSRLRLSTELISRANDGRNLCHVNTTPFCNLPSNLSSLTIRVLREDNKPTTADMIEELINKGYERQNNAVAIQTLVTNWLENIMQERSNNGRGLRVIPLNLYEFQIVGYGMFVGAVNLENKTCSCKEFNIDGFPCVHAIEACKH